MSIPVLVFGKHGPGVMYVQHPPPPVLRVPCLAPLPPAHSPWGPPGNVLHLAHRTFCLQMYVGLLSEMEEWRAWGEVQDVRTSRCASCGRQKGQLHGAGHYLGCDGFRPVVERCLRFPVYVEE